MQRVQGKNLRSLNWIGGLVVLIFCLLIIPTVVAAAVPPAEVVINIPAIAGVTVPVTGATPVTTITETDQYTGTITWNPADDPFQESTAYIATITLTAKAGFTLTGVAENFFTVVGATTTNAADSGVVTAVFPLIVPIVPPVPPIG